MQYGVAGFVSIRASGCPDRELWRNRLAHTFGLKGCLLVVSAFRVRAKDEPEPRSLTSEPRIWYDADRAGCSGGDESLPQQEPLVLLIAGQFEARGSCAYTLRLLEQLPSYGIRAEAICSSAEQVPRAKRRSLPIHESRYLEFPLINRLVSGQVAAEFGRLEPAMLHVQVRRMAWLGKRLAQVLEIPYVLTVHDFPTRGETLPCGDPWVRKIIAVSEAVRMVLREETGLGEELIEVIPSGVEIPDLPSLGRWDLAGRVPVIGTAGPLERVKGHHYFLDAARRVLDAGCRAEFVIAGAGREERNLRQLTLKLQIAEKVTFATHVRQYTEVLQALDIFVLPSLQQALGTVMIEAMALAKPVIASSVGGIYSVVKHNQNGLLIPGRDPVALAEAIAQLLEHPEEAARLGAAAREQVAREFNVQRMTQQTANLYRQVMGESQTAATRR